jgi:hypothetical protein
MTVIMFRLFMDSREGGELTDLEPCVVLNGGSSALMRLLEESRNVRGGDGLRQDAGSDAITTDHDTSGEEGYMWGGEHKATQNV